MTFLPRAIVTNVKQRKNPFVLIKINAIHRALLHFSILEIGKQPPDKLIEIATVFFTVGRRSAQKRLLKEQIQHRKILRAVFVGVTHRSIKDHIVTTGKLLVLGAAIGTM